MKKLTQKEIVEETIAYYETHSRGTRDESSEFLWEGCFYISKEGNKCAIGRCSEDPEYLEQLGGSVDNLVKHLKDNGYSLDDQLCSQYKGHPVYFWNLLQELHDDPNYWQKNHKGGWNLTERGKEYCQSNFKIKF